MYLSLFLSENMFNLVMCLVIFFKKMELKNVSFSFSLAHPWCPCSEAESDLDRPFVDRAFRTRTNRV